jgi:hypothetical protein
MVYSDNESLSVVGLGGGRRAVQPLPKYFLRSFPIREGHELSASNDTDLSAGGGTVSPIALTWIVHSSHLSTSVTRSIGKSHLSSLVTKSIGKLAMYSRAHLHLHGAARV